MVFKPFLNFQNKKLKDAIINKRETLQENNYTHIQNSTKYYNIYSSHTLYIKLTGHILYVYYKVSRTQNLQQMFTDWRKMVSSCLLYEKLNNNSAQIGVQLSITSLRTWNSQVRRIKHSCPCTPEKPYILFKIRETKLRLARKANNFNPFIFFFHHVSYCKYMWDI